MNTHHRYAIAFAFIAAAASAAACGSSDSLTVPDDGQGSGATGGGSGNYSAPVASSTPADNTPPPGVASNDAKAYFVANVYPLLMGTCGSCHAAPGSDGAPPWLSSTSASDAYTMIEARGYIDLSTSLLLKKGAHEGPALTSAESTAITQWLTLEQQVRGNSAPIDLLAKLGNCLDPTLFTAIALDKLQTTPRTDENTQRCTGCNKAYCQNCHEQGEYDMVSNDGKLGLSTIAQLQANATGADGSYLIEKYITTDGTNLVPATAIADKSTATQTGPAYSHPMFIVSSDMTTAIAAFAQDAISKYNAKTCGQ